MHSNIFLSRIRNPFFNSQIIKFLITNRESKYPLSQYNGWNPTFHQTLMERKIKKFETKPSPYPVSHNSTPKKNEGKQELAIVPRNLHDPPSHPSINIPFHFIKF